MTTTLARTMSPDFGGRPYKDFTDEQKEYIRKTYPDRNMRVQDIHKHVGCGLTKLVCYARSVGLTRETFRGKYPTNDERAEFQRLKNLGVSMKEMVKRTGRTATTIRKHLEIKESEICQRLSLHQPFLVAAPVEIERARQQEEKYVHSLSAREAIEVYVINDKYARSIDRIDPLYAVARKTADLSREQAEYALCRWSASGGKDSRASGWLPVGDRSWRVNAAGELQAVKYCGTGHNWKKAK